MKPAGVNFSTSFDSGIENNEKDLKFKVADHVIISKYKNIFAKGYVPNWFQKDFVIKKKLYILWCGRIKLVLLMVKQLLECFMKNKCKRQTTLGLK